MPASDRLGAIQARMQAVKSPLRAAHPQLIAVSKTQNAEAVESLIRAGQRIFGENRVQEAEEKFPALREKYPDLELHLIGSLQTNKVKDALTLFDVIETIDRISLVDAIVKATGNLQLATCNQFFIQVNTGEEEQKGGIAPADFSALLAHTHNAGLNVTGLMCVPPATGNPAPHFALLYKLAQENNLPNLSMGMSADFETALRLGATHIRIGTALFGERAP